MKKLILGFLISLSSTVVLADKFIIERGWAEDMATNAPNATSWYFKGVRDINENFAVDTSLQISQLDAPTPNNKVSARFDIGAIPKMNLYGPINGYTRFAVGEKFSSSSTGNFNFYSIEPGIRSTLGAGFWGQLGWRFRTPFNTANNDTTRTWRTSLNYDLTKKDTIGVRLDNQRGDQNQNIWTINYVRNF